MQTSTPRVITINAAIIEFDRGRLALASYAVWVLATPNRSTEMHRSKQFIINQVELEEINKYGNRVAKL
jgi:hypothetical protein